MNDPFERSVSSQPLPTNAIERKVLVVGRNPRPRFRISLRSNPEYRQKVIPYARQLAFKGKCSLLFI